MRNLKRIGTGLALVIATALVTGCTAEAGAADYDANELAVVVVETVIEELAAGEETGPEYADSVLFQSDEFAVKEIPLFPLVNSGFAIGNGVMFADFDAQSQSVADFMETRVTAGLLSPRSLFFIDTNRLTQLDEPWVDPATFESLGIYGAVGDFRLDVDRSQFWIDGQFNHDAFEAHLRGYEDIENGIPATIFAWDGNSFLFRLVDQRFAAHLRNLPIGVVNDDDSIDIQFSFDKELELVDAQLVENEFGSYSIHLYVNQGVSATQDTAWRITSDNQELFSEWSRFINVRFIDAETGQMLISANVDDTFPELGELVHIPELIEAERQLRIQYLANSGNQ